MTNFRASAVPTLPASARLTSGSRGYEGHILTRAEVARYMQAATGMTYRAAYRAAKAPRFAVGNQLFLRGGLGGHTGWAAFE